MEKAGELLMFPQEALHYLYDLEYENIQVYGINFWYKIDNSITEDPNSLDISRVTDVKYSLDLSRSFLLNCLPKHVDYVSFITNAGE